LQISLAVGTRLVAVFTGDKYWVKDGSCKIRELITETGFPVRLSLFAVVSPAFTGPCKIPLTTPTTEAFVL
jgi:hypothetical protein